MNEVARVGRIHLRIVRLGRKSTTLAIRGGNLLNALWAKLPHGEKGRTAARLEREFGLRKSTLYDYRRLAEAARDFPSLGKLPLWDAYVEAGIHRPNSPAPREGMPEADHQQTIENLCLPAVNLPRPVRLRDGSYACTLSRQNWRDELRRLLDEAQLLEQYLKFGLVLRTGSAKEAARERGSRGA